MALAGRRSSSGRSQERRTLGVAVFSTKTVSQNRPLETAASKPVESPKSVSGDWLPTCEIARNRANSRVSQDSKLETGLVGCPSWTHIEPCASRRSPLFGRFWRISGSFASPPRQPGSRRDGGGRSGGTDPLLSDSSDIDLFHDGKGVSDYACRSACEAQRVNPPRRSAVRAVGRGGAIPAALTTAAGPRRCAPRWQRPSSARPARPAACRG